MKIDIIGLMNSDGFKIWNVQCNLCGQLKLWNENAGWWMVFSRKDGCEWRLDMFAAQVQIIIISILVLCCEKWEASQKVASVKLAENFQRVINFASAILCTPIGKHYFVLSVGIKIISNEISSDMSDGMCVRVCVKSFWPNCRLR